MQCLVSITKNNSFNRVFLVTAGTKMLLYLYMIGYGSEHPGGDAWQEWREYDHEAGLSPAFIKDGQFLLEIIILPTGALIPVPALQRPSKGRHSIESGHPAWLDALQAPTVLQ